MFTKLQNSWNLVKASARVLSADKELVFFPAISGLALLLVSASFIAPLFVFGSGFEVQGAGVIGWVLLFLFYMVQYTVIFFFNSALVGAALIRLDGGDPTVGDGLRIAKSHFGSILGYAAIASTVGLILQGARERSNGLGSMVVGMLGVGWNLVTFLVVPVLVTHNVGPIDAIKESARILKQTWGEQIVGNAGVGFVFGFFHVLWTIIVVPSIIFAAMSGNPWLIVPVIVVGVLGYLTLALIGATLSGIYSAALYRFATSGQSALFDQRLLEGAFRQK